MAQDIALQQLAAQMQANLPASIKARMAAMVGVGGLGKELGEGITSGFAVVSLRGKVWRIKHRGEERTLLMPDGRTPRYSINVVIVKASPNIAKIWYETGYVEGSTAPPDCWSVDGKVPDRASPKLQNPTCAGCRWNAWGSSRTQGGSGKGKDCADSKRLAIVPAEDVENEPFGGPMLIRIPPASLGDLGAYSANLNAIGIPYFAVETELYFDHQAEYPKVMFKTVNVLDDARAEKVLRLYDSPAVERILATPVENVSTDGVDTTHTVQAQPGQQAPQQPPAGFVPVVVPKAEPAPSPAPAPELKPEPKPAPAVDPRFSALVAAGLSGQVLVDTAKAMGIPGTFTMTEVAPAPAPAPTQAPLPPVTQAPLPPVTQAPLPPVTQAPAGNAFAPPAGNGAAAPSPAPAPAKPKPRKPAEAAPAAAPAPSPAPAPAEATTPPSEAAKGADGPAPGTLPPDFENMLSSILG